MFRVSQHPSSGVLKTVPAASGTGHTTCTATPLQRGLVGTALYMFRVSQHPSSRVLKTVPAASGTAHTTPAWSGRDCFPTRPRWRGVAVPVL